MQVQHESGENKGAFYVEENGKRLAAMTYSMTPEKLLLIDHTEVDDSLRGKNVGYQLLQQLVEYARAENIKVIPLCPFAKATFEKKGAEFADVLRS